MAAAEEADWPPWRWRPRGQRGGGEAQCSGELWNDGAEQDSNSDDEVSIDSLVEDFTADEDEAGDTSAEAFAAGADPQGIAWERLQARVASRRLPACLPTCTGASVSKAMLSPHTGSDEITWPCCISTLPCPANTACACAHAPSTPSPRTHSCALFTSVAVHAAYACGLPRAAHRCIPQLHQLHCRGCLG